MRQRAVEGNVNPSLDVYPEESKQKLKEDSDSDEENMHRLYKPFDQHFAEREDSNKVLKHKQETDHSASIKTLQDKQKTVLELRFGIDFSLVNKSIQEFSELTHKTSELKEILKIYSPNFNEGNSNHSQVDLSRDGDHSEESDSDDGKTREIKLYIKDNDKSRVEVFNQKPDSKKASDIENLGLIPSTHQKNNMED